MSVAAKDEAGNLVHLELSGRLSSADHAALVYFVTKATQRHGTIRILVTLAGFEGWVPDDDWDDAGMRIPDDTAVAKAAVVGDARWKDEVFAFVGKPFRAIPVEFFADEAAARAWLDT